MCAYTESEYQQCLQTDGWSKTETDHLLELCRQYDLRFPVVHDRWDRSKFAARTIEEMKERYYDICNCLNRARHTTGPEPKVTFLKHFYAEPVGLLTMKMYTKW